MSSRRDLLRLANAIAELKGQGRALPWKLSFALALNARRLEPIMEAAQEAMKGPWDDVLAEFEQLRQALVGQFAERGADGTVLCTPGPNGETIAVMADQDAFNKAFQALHDAWRDRLEGANAAKATCFRELNDEPADDVPLVRVPLEAWEALDTALPINAVDALLPMIELGDPPPPKLALEPATPTRH